MYIDIDIVRILETALPNGMLCADSCALISFQEVSYVLYSSSLLVRRSRRLPTSPSVTVRSTYMKKQTPAAFSSAYSLIAHESMYPPLGGHESATASNAHLRYVHRLCSRSCLGVEILGTWFLIRAFAKLGRDLLPGLTLFSLS